MSWFKRKSKQEIMNEAVEEIMKEVNAAKEETAEPYEKICNALAAVTTRVKNADFCKRIATSSKKEAETRRALVFPFFSALNYDVGDVNHFLGEKEISVPGWEKPRAVDFVITPKNSKDFAPIILLETKNCDIDMHKAVKKDGVIETPTEQLAAYFDNTPEAELGILSNGKQYWFFGNDPKAVVDGKHLMQSEPFLTIDLEKIDADSETAKLPKDLEFLCFDTYDMKKVKSYVEKIHPFMVEKMKENAISDNILQAIREDIGHSEAVSDDNLRAWFIESMK